MIRMRSPIQTFPLDSGNMVNVRSVLDSRA